MDRMHTKAVWMVAGAAALVMALGGCKRTDTPSGTGTSATGSSTTGTATTGGGMTGSGTGTTSSSDMGASGAASAASR